MILGLVLKYCIFITKENTENYVIDNVNISHFSRPQKDLFNRNKENFIRVEKKLNQLGFSNRKCIRAIHANIWHESKGDPKAISGNFAGLFQIGGTGTMGQGTSISQRQNIETSVNIVFSKPYAIRWYKKHKYSDTTTEQAAEDFARNVLRCARQHIASRGSTARNWSRSR